LKRELVFYLLLIVMGLISLAERFSLWVWLAFVLMLAGIALVALKRQTAKERSICRNF